MKNKIPFSVVIANKVRQGIRSGVLVKDIMGSIQKYQYAPASLATFYKLYGSIMSEEKADVVSRIGDVVVQQALDGDFKAAEFYLRSKGGWSPTSTVNEVEQDTDPDTDESAIDSLMVLLGKSPDPEQGTPDYDSEEKNYG
jgi:hypothetical protein|tara:strand:+ start:1880 stop:2302 length:423 start_codon:yes stop_codon:yes gene_type:complete